MHTGPIEQTRQTRRLWWFLITMCWLALIGALAVVALMIVGLYVFAFGQHVSLP